MRRNKLWALLSAWVMLVLTLPLPPQANALPDDKDQPIHITADKAVRDEKRGVTIYSGNVEMRQGSMELDADTLRIFHASQDADKIVARGNPARMRQRPKIDEGLVHAHAEIITYFRSKELINLHANARIEREDGTLVTGDSIDYFVARELIRAESDRNGQGEQIKVVIPPSAVEEEDATEPTADDDNAPSATVATEEAIRAVASDAAKPQANDAIKASASGAAQGD